METYETEYCMYGGTYLTRRTVDAYDEDMAWDIVSRFDGVSRIVSIKIQQSTFTESELKEILLDIYDVCETSFRDGDDLEWVKVLIKKEFEKHPTKPIRVFEEEV